MTVCVAAIFNDGGIIGITDKMLSTDDMTFEPKGTSKKIFCLSKGINAMNAGHVGIQAEIMEALQSSFKVELDAAASYTVKGWVDLYVECYNRLKRDRVKDSVFAPYKLDENSFLVRQREFSDIFTRELMDQVARFHLPETATIIAGVDASTGHLEPHIYCIKRGYYENAIECCDAVGYAAIGTGARHVEAQFMQAKFTRHFSLPKALFLAYLAKKRSEIAPGVGKESDLFLIGPPLGVNTSLGNILDYKQLDQMYETIVSNEKNEMDCSFQAMAKILEGKLQFQPSPFD